MRQCQRSTPRTSPIRIALPPRLAKSLSRIIPAWLRQAWLCRRRHRPESSLSRQIPAVEIVRPDTHSCRKVGLGCSCRCGQTASASASCALFEQSASTSWSPSPRLTSDASYGSGSNITITAVLTKASGRAFRSH